MTAFLSVGSPARRICIETKKVLAAGFSSGLLFKNIKGQKAEDPMAWTTPVLVEICIGLEINGYLPADGYVPPEF